MSQLGGPRLTTRERDVVDVARSGSSTAQIAAKLQLSPRTVEHHLTSAYRKLGVSSRTELLALLAEDIADPAPPVHYARCGDAHIAYQTIGHGPSDLVLIPGFVSNVDTQWSWPRHASFLRALARGRRLIVFDKRGTGLSDPVPARASVTLEERMDEVRAVLDAAGSRRAAIFGFSEGAALGMLFAATYPGRTNGLVVYGGLISAALQAAPGRVEVFSSPGAAWEQMQQLWGTGDYLAPFVPSLVGVPNEMEHVARFERHGASPAAAFRIVQMAAEVELRGLCPSVRVPTLVLHRRQDPLVPVANGRWLAQHLPHVRYVELEGADHPPWVGDSAAVLTAVEDFLATEHRADGAAASMLVAFLTADRPLSPAQLPVIDRHGGRPASTGEGVMYVFDGPAGAAACALDLRGLDQQLRQVVHVGELRLAASGFQGPALREARAMLASLVAGDVVASTTSRHLALGTELRFSGPREVPGPSGEALTVHDVSLCDGAPTFKS